MQNLDNNKYPIWHPFTNQGKPADQILILKGKGSYLYDDNGKKLLDSISSWWVNLHGHSHPKIAKALYKQALKLEQVIFANFTHEPAINLATKVLSLFNNYFVKVFFSDNGSTSVEVAIKMALQYWTNNKSPRTKILALKNSYHGDTFGAMSVGSRSLFSASFSNFLFEVDFIDIENENVISELKKKKLEEYALFIYEPLLQAAGGMRMYAPEKLNLVLKYLKRYSIILIADEVMTGWGRTGKLFASNYCDIMPDIMCLSKGLTGGFLPLGLTICNEKIYTAFENEDIMFTFYHGHSFTANPLSCACANTSIDLLLKEKTLQNILDISLANKNLVENFKSKNIFNIRSLGTVLAFEFKNKDYNYSSDISKRITNYFYKYNIFIRPLGNTVYIMPPYSLTTKELKYLHLKIIEFVDAFE